MMVAMGLLVACSSDGNEATGEGMVPINLTISPKAVSTRTATTDIQSAHTVLHQWMQKYSYNNIAAFRGRLVPSDSIKNYHAVRNLYIRGLKEQREESSF